MVLVFLAPVFALRHQNDPISIIARVSSAHNIKSPDRASFRVVYRGTHAKPPCLVWRVIVARSKEHYQTLLSTLPIKMLQKDVADHVGTLEQITTNVFMDNVPILQKLDLEWTRVSFKRKAPPSDIYTFPQQARDVAVRCEVTS